MIVQPRQRYVKRFLQVIRFASVPVGSPIDVNFFRDRMPRHFVFVALVVNVAVPVACRAHVNLVGQRCAVLSPMAG